MSEKMKVYYDAECAICQISADVLNDTKSGSSFELMNVHTADLPEGLDRSKMLDEIYITLPDGKTVKNADAILVILHTYWYLRPFVWIGRLPGVIHVLRYLYGVLARHRYKISKHISTQKTH